MSVLISRICAVVLVLTDCIFLPFLPWTFDPLAVPFSTTIQLTVAGGVLLLPVSLPWLIYEVVCFGKTKRVGIQPKSNWRFAFAAGLLGVGTILGVLCSLIVIGGVSLTFGVSNSTYWLVNLSGFRKQDIMVVDLRETRDEPQTPTFSEAAEKGLTSLLKLSKLIGQRQIVFDFRFSVGIFPAETQLAATSRA